ncbi:MAG: hypothetical protein OXH41_12335 [Chloroflexi bacterium]|nr:hypothetical protein [Chloroflexota bacterium]
MARNPNWAEEELVLALDLYLRLGDLGPADAEVIEVSRFLNTLAIHPDRPQRPDFRNPNGVALKTANFAAIDPNHPGLGMRRGGKLDAEVWDRYASDREALAAAVAAVREGNKLADFQFADSETPQVIETEVEAQHVEQFQVSVTARTIEADRREQRLVLAYCDHLESQGHLVKRNRYRLPDHVATLVCDLVDETDKVLYEAKGDTRRTSVRMAIGQLLDYRLLERRPMSLAVLLPTKPARDLIELINSVPASAVWQTEGGFERSEPAVPGAPPRTR